MSKVTITPVETNTFKPFTLNIQVDSEEELAVLTSMFHANKREICDNALSQYWGLVTQYLDRTDFKDTISSKVFNVLNAKFRAESN